MTMAWPKGVSRKEYDAQRAAQNERTAPAAPAAVEASAAAAKPEGRSIAAPKVSVNLTHPETGMGVPQREAPSVPAVPPTVTPAGGGKPFQYAGRTYDPIPVKKPEGFKPPKDLFSGHVKKLEVFGRNGDPKDPIPGFALYWFNDESDYVLRALEMGYRFVDKDEVLLNDSIVSEGNNSLGGDVRRYVGTQVDGRPKQAYLMKIPQWLHDENQRERERLHQKQEAALKGGLLEQGADRRHSYVPGQDQAPTSMPGISIETSLVQNR